MVARTRMLRLPGRVFTMMASVALSGWANGQTQPIVAQPDPSTQNPSVALPSSVKDGFRFAAVGDLVGPQQPQTPLRDAEFAKVTQLLKDADVAFADETGSIFDIESFEGYPAPDSGGTLLAVTGVARDLRDMGLNVVSKANNHATDWGIEGLRETERALDEASVAHAGSGRNRAAARAPIFLATPHGRIALLATASTFATSAVAGQPEGQTLGRPGISVIRTQKIVLVTAAEMVGLRAIAAAHGSSTRGSEQQLKLFGQTYRVADKVGITYEVNSHDRSEILTAIRGAKQVSDLTVFSVHAHEAASELPDDPEPADFLKVLFHEAIDAGADIVVGHGPHSLRGIEIYKGKPIFYGLGSFFFALDQGEAISHDALEDLGIDSRTLTYPEYIRARLKDIPCGWYKSVISISEFRGGRIKEIRLYPLDLGCNDKQRLLPRGTPRLASQELGREILDSLRRNSAQFGTEVLIENAVGVIRVDDHRLGSKVDEPASRSR